MNAGQRILRERRQYNKWANSQTLEDYALRFTANAARRWSAGRVAGTALGATSFLACEAIGATITLHYGFGNAMAAILASMALMFLIGLPIAYHAARDGLDIDLMTRGAGFGYLGSTITSLIYASFTFLLFAIEASIMSAALELALGIPPTLANVLSTLVVVPIALYGMRAIAPMQAWTQPVWLILQFLPAAYLLVRGGPVLERWAQFPGQGGIGAGIALLPFGLALSTLLSLLPQIGEQADYLRFLPEKARIGRARWWTALIASGPGWVIMGGLKITLGSALAVYFLGSGGDRARAENPTDLFYTIFRDMAGSPGAALAMTMVLVVVAQMKINVTNAYAGSIAWSNFFSRLTHAHPGRVVWLVFNALLALALMQLGVLSAISGILILYANLACAWIGALSADLVISKPLGLSPRQIEFKRAHLYDINPVGVGAVILSILVSTAALARGFGPLAQAFAPLLGLATAFVAAPALALVTRGRFYLARQPADLAEGEAMRCVICENRFERPDMAHCPVYQGSICSLCCTLEARCHDRCKMNSTAAEQASSVLRRVLPRRMAALVNRMIGHFAVVLFLFTGTLGGVLWLVYFHYSKMQPSGEGFIGTTVWIVFVVLAMLSGVAAWLIVLAHESRRAAERDTHHHTEMLRAEIIAHDRTDRALQHAKDAAEAANLAKTRFLVAMSHELRSPLNAIYGYAQLMNKPGGTDVGAASVVIRRSAEHLTSMIDGLLEISRVESGVVKLERDVIPLPTMLADVLTMFRAQAEQKGIALVYTPVGRIPQFVRTDEKRFRQILINLLSNAIKYTDRGSAELRITVRSQVATIDVIDTGIGIQPADQQRIFEPFERVQGAATSKQPGVGLGLAISRVLAHILGGELQLHSTPGSGSRFTLRLMLPEPLNPPASSARAGSVTGYNGPRRRLLLIDDDPVQLTILTGLLSPLGFVVETARSGLAGIALAAKSRPDAVLLDIQMPELDGWATAERLRTAHGEAIRIIIVSANAHEFSAGNDGGAAHDGFVTKPVEFSKLLDVLGRSLRLTWHSAPEDPGPAPASASGASTAAVADWDGAGGEAFVADLRRLGRIGYVGGIRRKLDDMAEALPASRPYVDRLRGQVAAFDIPGFLRTLDGDGGTHG